MFNTEIVQSCSARSHSTKVGGIVFRELNNSLVFSVLLPQIFPSYLKNVLIFEGGNFSFKYL